MICNECGRELMEGTRFCGACGRPVVAPAASFVDDYIGGSLREVVLVDKMTGAEIFRSPVFRFVFLVAMGPLAIALLQSNTLILNGLAIYSALLWSMLLYRLFADRDLTFRWAIGMVLFTCFVMVPVLEVYLAFPPHITEWLTTRAFLPFQFVGYVAGVGVREEMCKAAPLLALALLSARMKKPLNGLVLGMMSGVGFAAAENVYYVYKTVSLAADATRQTGALGNLVVPVYNNVIRMAMGPFVHGCLSGIFGYLISLAATDAHRRIPLLMAGLGLSAFLHGLYDTVVGYSQLLALLVQAFTYFLLMTYILKARGLASARDLGGGIFQRTVMGRVPDALRTAASAPATLAPTVPDSPPALRTWRLRGFAGPVSGLSFPVEGETRLGRDPARCSVHLAESTVSREHAEIWPDAHGGGWRIRRLSVTAPLYVNDQPVEEAALAAGDRIRVGTAVLVLEVD